MKFDPKVVPFHRGADFVYQRAMKNLRDNNMLGAVELMRKAVEESPDNISYRLDLAEMLGELGCHDKSNRMLLDLINSGADKYECIYSIALNKLNTNDTDVAKKLLRVCMDARNNSDLREQANSLNDEIEIFEEINRPRSRRAERVLAISDMACDKLRHEDFSGARRLFERALSLDGTFRDIRALLAMTCALANDKKAARKHAELAVAKPNPTICALSVSGQVFGMLGNAERGRGLIEEAIKLKPEPLELRMIILALFEIKQYDIAFEQALIALKDTPYDKMLLHVTALCALKSQGDASQAARYWRKITIIDPDDTVAEYYLNSSENGSLDVESITCEYQVPRVEAVNRFMYIAGKLDADVSKLSEEWKNNSKFRKLLTWCLSSGDMRFCNTAVTLIATIDDPIAESVIREYMFRANAGFDLAMRAAYLYQIRGADILKIMPPFFTKIEDLAPDGNEMLLEQSVGHRQLVRLASEALENVYGISAFNRLAYMWDTYRRSRITRTDPLVQTESAAAALVYCYLLTSGRTPDVAAICAELRCSMRQMEYFAKHMIAVLKRDEEDDDEAD